uniref:Putative conserved plasma membrane protein n=1 Tax=Amblyomma triste TaxID=251400 RepID=A0A023GEE9_AMBTT
MWVVTLSCFPLAVFQAEQLFEAALQGHAYTLGSSWLQAVNLCSAVLLTGFACVKFNNRHAQITFTWPTVQSVLRTAAEHAAWLPLLAARVLAFAVLIAKALEPTHVFGIFFALSLHFEFRRDRASLLAGQPRGFLLNVATNVARAAVGMFFKLRNWQEPLAAKPYVVFAIMLFVQSFGCIFLPFLQQYGFSMSMDAFLAYYAAPVFFACIGVHYALLVIGTAFLVVWYRVEGAGTSGYGAI